MCYENDKDTEYESELKNLARKDREETEALFKNISLTHRERDYIRFLLLKELKKQIDYSNFVFDTGIAEYEKIVMRTLTMLRKISNSHDKFMAEIEEMGKQFEETGQVEVDIDLDDKAP